MNASGSGAARNAVRLVDVPAPRGRIYDANGNELVKNRMSVVLTVNRQEAGDSEEEIIFQLSTYAGMPAVNDALDVYREVLKERGEWPIK